MEILLFVVGIVWLIFPFAVINGISKQRAANRSIVQHLEAIERFMQEANNHFESANKMHGDLNRAAQWMIDRLEAGRTALNAIP